MGALVVETPPAAEPLTLDVAKSHLRVTIASEDTLIGVFLQAAREGVESFLGRSLVEKGYRQSLDSFPYYIDSVQSQQAYPPQYYSSPRYSTTLWNYSQMIKLLRAPLRKVTNITYIQPSGVPATLYPAPFLWQPITEYDVGDQVQDSNGNLQEVTAATESEEGGASLSGSSAPTWASGSLGQTTTDGDLTWTLKKKPAPVGDFIYDPDSEPPRIFPPAGSYWPPCLYVPNAVQIHFVSGYGSDGTNVPALAKVGILQATADWYRNRETITPETLKEIPGREQDLITSLRIIDLAP